MTDKQRALRDLLDKVEAGDGLSWNDFRRAFGINPDDRHVRGHSAYNGSLDAALALHNAVLPGWDWRLEDNVQGYICQIGPAFPEFKPTIFALGFESAARTFLTADLKALIAKGEAE